LARGAMYAELRLQLDSRRTSRDGSDTRPFPTRFIFDAPAARPGVEPQAL
jgi:hypothetical protein